MDIFGTVTTLPFCTSLIYTILHQFSNHFKFILLASRLAFSQLPQGSAKDLIFDSHYTTLINSPVRRHGFRCHLYSGVHDLALGHSVVSNSCNSMDCSPPGSSVHGDSPGKNPGVGCHALLQGIFPTQGSNPGLPHSRRSLYCLHHHSSLTSPAHIAPKLYPFCSAAYLISLINVV